MWRSLTRTEVGGGAEGEEDDRRKVERVQWGGGGAGQLRRRSKGGGGGGARLAAAAGPTAVVSAWPGQGVAAVVAATATMVGLLPRPSVSSHSRWRRLLSFFLK